MTYQNVIDEINKVKNGQRKKIKPKMPPVCKVNGKTYTWIDIYNKYYDPEYPANPCHTDNNMFKILKSQGIDPHTANYELFGS